MHNPAYKRIPGTEQIIYKMKKFFPAALLPALLLFSCNKEQDGSTLIGASIPQEVPKTYLDFPYILWSPDDAIAVNGKFSTAVSIKTGSRSATFTLPSLQAPYYALYPTSAFVSGSFDTASGKYGSLTLPSEQTYKPGSFDSGAALMYGWSQDTEDVNFSCATAFMKIVIQGGSDSDDIKRIEISALDGTDMSGTLSYKPSEGMSRSKASTGKAVIVRSSAGIAQGSPVYAAIMPGVYGSGLKMRIVDVNGHYKDYISAKSFTADAGVIYDTSLPFNPTGTLMEGSTPEASDPAPPVAYTKETTLIRTSTADPCLIYEDGNFYLTMTGTSNIAMICEKSLDRLTTDIHPISPSLYVYKSSEDPNVKLMFGDDAEINGTWSPELHYFSEDDFHGMSGWYMFLALRKKSDDSSQLRMVVLKSLSGTPAGPFGDPVDGTPNKSRQVLAASGSGIGHWSCGQTILRIPSGKYAGIYAMWIEEEGRGEGYGNFYQKIMISRMSSPWSFTGETGIITTPTQVWEKDGASDVLPMVVEGPAAIYGEHGEIFIAYCGSGYWSLYGLGQLTLLRDGDDYANPLETSSWMKQSYRPPVFSSRHSDFFTGAGHGFFLKDEMGNGFFVYHAYPVVDGVKASARNAYMEPYYIDYETTSASAPYGLLTLGINGDRDTAPVNSSFTFYVKGE